MFVDHAVIKVRSGRGGDGCSHMRREKFMPKGGPDGGDGGRGGDVIVVGDPHLDTLIAFRYRMHFFAENGGKGQTKSCHGADGASIRVALPLGSQVFDAETDELLVDLTEAGQEFVVARGGRGGLGNERFKSATRQAPTESTPGEDAQERSLRIELKLIADVGLVGMPNAGKSTLLRAISRANAKVGAYPFTTISPQLGIAELPGDRRLVIADLPGLIEGAAQGAGLGHDFLRHIERTRVIVHLVDMAPTDGTPPADRYRAIRGELEAFSVDLARKPELVVLSKLDLVPHEEQASVCRAIGAAMGLSRTPLAISGATGVGLPELLEACWALSEKAESAPRFS
ncbi:MAG: GTPase ObgE [Phycisphaeraceae bacterium]|nr:GTPase ObgE [Phycisphaeraceae bacterium]